MDTNVAFFVGLIAAWVALYGVFHGKKKDAIKKRRASLLFKERIEFAVADVEDSWVWLNRFFGLSIAAFFCIVLIDYADVSYLIPIISLFQVYAFVFLALAGLEVWHMTKFVDNIEYGPELRWVHATVIPILILMQGVSGYTLVQLLEVSAKLNIFGYEDVVLLALTFPLAYRVARITVAVANPLSARTKASFGPLILYLLPFIIILLEQLLFSLGWL